MFSGQHLFAILQFYAIIQFTSFVCTMKLMITLFVVTSTRWGPTERQANIVIYRTCITAIKDM